MDKKITISANLNEGTQVMIFDYSKLAREGEAIIEVHYNYDSLKKYNVFYYPEGFENAKKALNNEDAWVSKIVYHIQPENA